ncbi:MAG: response regulator transcription factor [Elusimicrobiota bacterium]
MAKIIVFEDDPGYQELLRVLLADYEVSVCASVEEASNHFGSGVFDLILCDINLLGMSGFELLQQMRDSGLTEKIPFIFCSSQSDPATKERALEMGAAGFVAKPFDADALLSLVRAIVKK